MTIDIFLGFIILCCIRFCTVVLNMLFSYRFNLYCCIIQNCIMIDSILVIYGCMSVCM